MAVRFNLPALSFLNDNANPLAGGTLTFYESETSTPLATFSDDDLTTANNNPLTLDAAGRHGDIFLQALDYKVILKDASGITIKTMDPVHGYTEKFSVASTGIVSVLNPTTGDSNPSFGLLSAASSASDLDAACAAAGIPWHLDADITLGADTTFAAKVIGMGGVISTNAHNLTGNFWAPPNVAMFDAAGTGLITITNGSRRFFAWFSPVADGKVDGTGTDNANAIVRAIKSTYAGTFDGVAMNAPLIVGPGMFRFGSKITIQNPGTINQIKIVGPGRGCAAWLADFTDDDAIEIIGGGVTFNGVDVLASTSRSAGTSGCGVVCSADPHTTAQGELRLKNFTSKGHPGDGLNMTAPDGAIVEHVWGQNCGGRGIKILSDSTGGINCRLVETRCIGNQKEGYYLDASALTLTGITLDNIESLDNCQDGVTDREIHASGSCLVFINPDVENANGASLKGLVLSGTSNILMGGFFGGFGSYAVYGATLKDSKIINPLVKGNGQITPASVFLDSNSVNNVVEVPQILDGAVTTNVVVSHANNKLVAGGVDQWLAVYPSAPGSTFTPDLSLGTRFVFDQAHSNSLTANLIINAPTNRPKGNYGTRIRIEIQQPTSGGPYTVAPSTGSLGFVTPAIGGTAAASSTVVFEWVWSGGRNQWMASNVPTWM